MAVPVPSISCCVLNYHNLFYQVQNALVFNWDMCCHLVLCLWLLPFHCDNWHYVMLTIPLFNFMLNAVMPIATMLNVVLVNVAAPKEVLKEKVRQFKDFFFNSMADFFSLLLSLLF